MRDERSIFQAPNTPSALQNSAGTAAFPTASNSQWGRYVNQGWDGEMSGTLAYIPPEVVRANAQKMKMNGEEPLGLPGSA